MSCSSRLQKAHLLALFLLLLLEHSALAEDYYEVLGLNFAERPSDSDIKKAYHRLALQHHPDKVAKDDVEQAQQQFIKIAAAYEILGDTAKRLQYDNMRAAHAAEQQQQREKQEQKHRQETGSSFGGGSRGFYREEDPPPGEGWQEQSSDYFFHVDVSLEHVYTGAHAAFSTQVAIVCPMCAGSGRCRVHSPLLEGGGSGGGSDLQAAHQLAVMHEHHYHDAVCPRCGGGGRLPHNIQQSFYIPPGAHEGMKARIEGTANAQVLVFSTPHSRFIRRDNVHLDHVLVLTASEAQLGWSRDIVHLDGRSLRVVSGRPSADGDVVIVQGEGMPVFGSPWQKGDLFVNLSISLDHTVLLGGSSRILLLPDGGTACSSVEAQGLELLFAPDALGSGVVLRERRLQDSDASIALLLPGDNITIATPPLSHQVLLNGIDLPVRGSPSSVMILHISCLHTNGETVASLLQQAPQSAPLELDTWRTLHFAMTDPVLCPAAARVSLQVSKRVCPTHLPSIAICRLRTLSCITF